jgi:hypothetical protein
MVVVQAFINECGVGSMPTKGIPTLRVLEGRPVLTLACVGVLLNITKQTD